MGGLFGCISKENCVNDLFYGTDYHSHLGTKRGGLAVRNAKEIKRSIHNGGSLEDYATAGSKKNNAMIEKIRKRLKLTTLEYQRLEDLVEAIGLPREKVCTHCWDGSSYF